jgi:hypothetical protein
VRLRETRRGQSGASPLQCRGAAIATGGWSAELMARHQARLLEFANDGLTGECGASKFCAPLPERQGGGQLNGLGDGVS